MGFGDSCSCSSWSACFSSSPVPSSNGDPPLFPLLSPLGLGPLSDKTSEDGEAPCKKHLHEVWVHCWTKHQPDAGANTFQYWLKVTGQSPLLPCYHFNENNVAWSSHIIDKGAKLFFIKISWRLITHKLLTPQTPGIFLNWWQAFGHMNKMFKNHVTKGPRKLLGAQSTTASHIMEPQTSQSTGNPPTQTSICAKAVTGVLNSLTYKQGLRVDLHWVYQCVDPFTSFVFILYKRVYYRRLNCNNSYSTKVWHICTWNQNRLARFLTTREWTLCKKNTCAQMFLDEWVTCLFWLCYKQRREISIRVFTRIFKSKCVLRLKG